MDSKNPTFLKQIELPEYCFLSEAVEWIALGRVPEVIISSHIDYENTNYQPRDFRFSEYHLADGLYLPWNYEGYSELEFKALEIDIPFRYFEAVSKTEFFFEESNLDLIAHYEKKLGTFQDGSRPWEEAKRTISKLKSEIQTMQPYIQLVTKIDEKFKVYLEKAFAELFACLVGRDLQIEALNYDRFSREIKAGTNTVDGYLNLIGFETIPHDALSLGMDWQNNELVWNDDLYRGTRVNVGDFLKLYDSRLSSGEAGIVNQIGQCFVSKTFHPTESRKRRGPKTQYDWATLKRFLADIVSNRKVPVSKENCIYEIQAYAEIRMGKAPSRSAIQASMGKELDAIYASN